LAINKRQLLRDVVMKSKH